MGWIPLSDTAVWVLTPRALLVYALHHDATVPAVVVSLQKHTSGLQSNLVDNNNTIDSIIDNNNTMDNDGDGAVQSSTSTAGATPTHTTPARAHDIVDASVLTLPDMVTIAAVVLDAGGNVWVGQVGRLGPAGELVMGSSSGAQGSTGLVVPGEWLGVLEGQKGVECMLVVFAVDAECTSVHVWHTHALGGAHTWHMCAQVFQGESWWSSPVVSLVSGT